MEGERRARARTLWTRFTRALWRLARALLLAGSAIGPRMPPPPPPAPAPTEQVAEDGQEER
jgi:hypothetical protein